MAGKTHEIAQTITLQLIYCRKCFSTTAQHFLIESTTQTFAQVANFFGSTERRILHTKRVKLMIAWIELAFSGVLIDNFRTSKMFLSANITQTRWDKLNKKKIYVD